MQQLTHAAAFLTAVTPPVYLSGVAKDGCCIVGLRYTLKLTSSSAVAVSFGTRGDRRELQPVGVTITPTVASTVAATIAPCIHTVTGPSTGSNFTKRQTGRSSPWL